MARMKTDSNATTAATRQMWQRARQTAQDAKPVVAQGKPLANATKAPAACGPQSAPPLRPLPPAGPGSCPPQRGAAGSPSPPSSPDPPLRGPSRGAGRGACRGGGLAAPPAVFVVIVPTTTNAVAADQALPV